MGYQGYNDSGLVNIPDNKIGTQMLDKLSRVKSDRRQKPLDQMDNIRYSHRAMYDGFNLLIGDTYFMIPPEFIMVNSEATSQSIVTLRQENTQKEKSGYHKRIILIDLVFNGIEQLNGYKVEAPHIIKRNDDGTIIYDNEGYYYVDGLRQLLAQFKCTPILPITNELINGMYGIFTVALQSITMSTVDGFPNTMTAQITLQEVCMFPYIEMPDICFKYMIDWDLFRYYYQTFLTENHVYKRLQSLPANHEHNRFRMSILDNSIFALDSDKTGVDEYNVLDVVCDKTILREGEDTNYITWIDSNESDCVISSFQCGYSNLLTNIQLSDMSSPTVQFMGGMDTIYNITFETTDYSVVQALEQCQIANDMITRNNGKIRSSVGFIKLESELVEFTGSLFVMIESIATNTVPGFPGLYNVQMNCVSYDIAQSEREALNGFMPFDCNKAGRCGEYSYISEEEGYGYVSDHKHDEQAIPNSKAGLWNKIQQDNYAEWKLRTTMEVYPDLRLPKYKEVDEAIEAIKAFRSSNGLSALPYSKYPVQPMGMMHGCNLDKNISASYSDSKQAIIFPKDIDKSSLEYNVYVDPDFYVFYPASYVSFGDEEPQYYDSVLTPPQREGYTKTKIKYQHPNYDSTSNTSGNGNLIEDFIALARSFIGHTYVWGAEGEITDSKGKCFDCSGFVTFLLKEMGIMPASQDRFTVSTMPGSDLFEKVAWSDMKRGDILCNSDLSHVVIYEGDNQIVHAANKSPYPKGGVKESSLYFNSGTCLRVKAFYDSSMNNTESYNTNTSGFYVTDEFLKMIEGWEGFLDKATAKDGGIDIGFGFHNTYFDGTKNVKIKYGMTMTREQAEKYLKLELESMIPNTLNKLKKYGWNPSDFTNNQILALTSYFFNRGYYNDNADAILNKKNSPNITAIGNNLPNYWGSASYAKKGLINRRNAEKSLFFSDSSGSSSGSNNTSTNSKYTLTQAEFESICRYVMQETKGETSDAEKAMAQVIYDRMTSGSGRFGGLSNILNSSEGFDTYYTGELNDTIENNVKAVFCDNNKYWKNSIVYYFLTPDAPNVSYKARDNEYDRLGNVAMHTYWGHKRKGSSIKYTIVEGDGTGAASDNNQSESTDVQHKAYTLDDIDRFGEPIIVRTEYTQKRGSGDHWRDTVNSTDNIFYTSFVNDYQYSARGRFVRAFPAYLFCILDDQAQWFDGKKLWTNYYTHKSVVDIAVHETNDMPTATATIVVNNSYHNLDRTQGGLSNYSIQNDKDYNGLVKKFHKWTGMLIGCGPKLTSTLIELHQVIYNHARLREDARVCLRMGYGSDPLSLAPVINGHISDVSLGSQISIVVTSDGHEFLQHVMDSNSEKDGENNGFFGLGATQESSNIIGKILCVRASWMHYLSSKWGEASKYSIEHFGLYNNQTLLSNFDYSNVSGQDIADMADAGYDIGKSIGMDIPVLSDITGGLGWLLGGAGGIIKEGVDIVGDTVSGIGETISDIWNEYSEQYDILKNIYKAGYKAETYHHNNGWIFDGEENVVFTDYNMTPWDVFQVCTQQVPEYIVKPSYHQFDSRLYFGLPFWIEKFRYDIINGSPHEECKASTQVHYLCSLTNIIDNQVRVTSKYSFTNIKVMYQRGSSAVTTQVIHSDDTIDYSRQKTRILDTPIVQDAFGPDLVYELLGYDVGDESARRTGISNLLYGWQQQYQGELLCLGCPGIYAHDYLMLNDMFANMFGVCIVREVVHSFSTNTGFTTGIVPGMIGFSTDENSGLIETTQNYLMMASLFASYSSQRRGLKNACEANMQLLADMEVARQKMDALCDYVNNWQTADTVYQVASTAGLGLLIYKTAKNMQTALKVLKTTKDFVAFGKDLYKGAKAGKNVVKGLKTMFTAIEAGGAAAAPETLGVSLVVTVIMFMIDALLDEFFEWFSNKNVCVLLPLYWENYPFVSGVKDGEKILLMPSNSTGTKQNNRSDAEVESNDN